MGITLQTATQFVADVEAAVKDGVVTVQQLCEIWECPVPEGLVKVVGLSQVSLGDISKATTKAPPKDETMTAWTRTARMRPTLSNACWEAKETVGIADRHTRV